MTNHINYYIWRPLTLTFVLMQFYHLYTKVFRSRILIEQEQYFIHMKSNELALAGAMEKMNITQTQKHMPASETKL